MLGTISSIALSLSDQDFTYIARFICTPPINPTWTWRLQTHKVDNFKVRYLNYAWFWHAVSGSLSIIRLLFRYEEIRIPDRGHNICRGLKTSPNYYFELAAFQKLLLFILSSVRFVQRIRYSDISSEYATHTSTQSSQTGSKFTCDLRRAEYCLSQPELVEQRYQSIIPASSLLQETYDYWGSRSPSLYRTTPKVQHLRLHL